MRIVSMGIDVTSLKSVEDQLEEVNNNLTAAKEELTGRQRELSAINKELMVREAVLQKYQEALKKLADIPLRAVFMDRLNAYIADAKKSGLKLAVLFIDIDNFKTINDTYGHHIGDKHLKRIAGKLKSCIRNSDILSRIGGDEFALLLPGFTKVNEADEIANSIIESFNKPMSVNGHKLYTTISMGIAVYPDNGQNGKTLIKRADIAMHMVKENGKNGFLYFDNYMAKEISFQSVIKKGLRAAIVNEEFFLCYQPLIDIKAKRMVAVEALIRWRHPVKGMISPVEFIPIAEEMGLIIQIGEWVLQAACRQLKEWNNLGCSDFGISVNVSIIQLQQPDFAEVVSRVLEETGLPSRYLELEITENILIESTCTVVKNLNSLKKQGVKISIDDFGTGYSCLEYLQKLSVNSLKIDKTFICNIKIDVNKAIVDSIISLGHKLNMEITAEGVETEEQYHYLKAKGCDKVQGYYFSKPLLPEELTEALEASLQTLSLVAAASKIN